jgi:hypothetical protein
MQTNWQEYAKILVGKWAGKGTVMVHGKQIPYLETAEFKLLKQAPCLVINVQQFTKHAETGNPMHAENGFMKIKPDYSVEASYSHPFSMNEFEFGTVTAESLTLVADQEHHF